MVSESVFKDGTVLSHISVALRVPGKLELQHPH